MVSATLEVIEILAEGHAVRARLRENSAYFRTRMSAGGFALAGADHAIVPVMLGDAKLAVEMASRMLAAGVFVVGFCFPVVPQGQARIRCQMSAAHTRDELDQALRAIRKVGQRLGIV
jgi:glycine C-acetyltransferase